MTTKTKTRVYPEIRTIGFYADDDERIEIIREKLAGREPARKMSLPDVIRYALYFAAINMPD